MYIFDKQLIKKSQKNKITSILIYFIIIQFSTIFETTSPYFPHTLYIYIHTHSIQFFQGLEGRGERRGQTMPRNGYRLLLLPAQLAARWRLFGKVSTRLPLLPSPPRFSGSSQSLIESFFRAARGRPHHTRSTRPPPRSRLANYN